MASTELGSAIDDSFEPNFFPISTAPSNAPDPSTYNGPRSGHWSVSSSIRSAIDDRCPTIWGALPGPVAGGSHDAAVRPIDASLLKKLGRTAVEKAVAAEAARDQSAREADKVSQASVREATRPKQSVPTGFYVPKVRGNSGLENETKAEQKQDVKAPAKKAAPATKKVREPSPQRPAKSPYSAPLPSSNNARAIRIIGKDGQEAFVQLPSLPRVPKSPPPAPVARPKKHAEKEARKIEKPLEPRPERAPSAREKAAEVAAEALMSGALPAPKKQKAAKQAPQKPPSPAPSAPPRSTRSSAKDSGIRLGGVFEGASNAPSAATSISASAKSLQEAIMNINRNSERSTTTLKHEIEEVGEGWVKTTSSTPPRSTRSSVKESAVGFGGMFEEIAGSKHSSAVSKPVSAKSLQEAVRNISQNSRKTTTPSDRGFQAMGEDWTRIKTPSERGSAAVDEGWVHAATSIRTPKPSSAKQRTPLARNVFEAAREGWAQQAAPNSRSRHASWATPSPMNGYEAAGRGWGQQSAPNSGSRQASAKWKTPSPIIIEIPSSEHEHAFNGGGSGFGEVRQDDPTVFAGKGWISPHPLSRAPSRIASPPQSHISLPFTTLHGREMSYDEWKAVQDGQIEINRKRFLRAESAISSQVLAVAEGIARGGSRQGSVRGSVAGSQTYRKATVESEQGSQRSARGSLEPSKPASAGGWDALRGLGGYDGTSDMQVRDSAELASDAYRQYLNGIIVSDHTRGSLTADAREVHLAMPWDRGQRASSEHGPRNGGAGADVWHDRHVHPQSIIPSRRGSANSDWQGKIDKAERGFAGW